MRAPFRLAARHAARTLRALLAAALLAPAAHAQDAPESAGGPPEVVVVGIKEAAPFAMRDQGGDWGGLSVELWRRAADSLGTSFEFRPLGLSELLDAVAAGEVDVGLGALTITPERERSLDFTHPFLATGLGIAVPRAGGALAAFRGLLTRGFWVSLGALLSILLGVALLFWLAERRGQPLALGRGLRGLGTGFWWSAVTMTTVGYGDVVPRTSLGRAVGVVWMFASVIIISAFTGAIASSLTVTRLGSVIASPDDLYRVRVGTAEATAAAAHLDEVGVAFRGYPDVETAVAALSREEVDAVVYDAPILRYLARGQFAEDVQVLPFTVARQDYAFALVEGSALREPLNRTILEAIQSQGWSDVVRRYLGVGGSAPQ